jgi:hypothetical protein
MRVETPGKDPGAARRLRSQLRRSGSGIARSHFRRSCSYPRSVRHWQAKISRRRADRFPPPRLQASNRVSILPEVARAGEHHLRPPTHGQYQIPLLGRWPRPLREWPAGGCQQHSLEHSAQVGLLEPWLDSADISLAAGDRSFATAGAGEDS